MARLRKYHVNNTVLFLTFSIEEGLLLLSNPLIEFLLKGCLAHAQSHHPVKICHYLMEATHVHMIVVVENPDDIRGFIERFKTESSHRINRILGRKKRTIWCEGYDSPIVLTVNDVINKIVYIYTNPSKDNLEDSIEEYPGLSSWRMFQRKDYKKNWKFARRAKYMPLTKDANTPQGYIKIARKLSSGCKETILFKIEPDAWMNCFEILDQKRRQELNDEIHVKIRTQERQYRLERSAKGSRVLGKKKLMNELLNTTHQSERHGRKVWCICEDIEFRKEFITFLQELSKRATEVYRRWVLGDFSEAFPMGMYSPSMPKLVNPISFY